MHLRSHLLSIPSTSSPIDNRAHPLANTSQASDLEGIHREMHGIVEQISVMNEISTRLIHHLNTNNPPPTTPILEEVDRSCHSRRYINHDSQICQSTRQAYSTRTQRHQSPSLHSRQASSHVIWESRSSSRTHDTGGEETRRKGRSPLRDDQMHRH